MSKRPISICWFRRDLRLQDNAALYHALNSAYSVLPLFIFDKDILDKLDDKKDKRVDFIHQQIERLKHELKALGSDMLVFYNQPHLAWEEVFKNYDVKAIYANHDYEPYALERDKRIQDFAKARGTSYHSFKDQCIFEKDEITKDDGKPYTVFTPYSRKWKAKFSEQHTNPYPTEKCYSHFLKTTEDFNFPKLEQMGFKPTQTEYPSIEVAQGIIRHYDKTRNFPSIEGTSRLGIHFRFGTISIREKARKAAELNETYLNELIWRDFYMQILYHFPQVTQQSFKPKYDSIAWRNNEEEFAKWCEGKTGYPIVDAGMRELNETGYMHNRVRMIVASFLTKHLLIDWRWGEAYFAKKLLDFDLSANNGGWQWASGSGTDAAPYFRVFNPALQTEKFDKQLVYIKKWIPELNSSAYPKPIVQHEYARKRCLETYKAALG